MGRKKQRTLGVLALQPGFAGFSEDDVKKIEGLLGHGISMDLKTDLEGQINAWLQKFSNFRSFGFGANERRLVCVAQRSAAKLYSCLQELGELADAGLDRFTYAQGMTNEQFMTVLGSFEQFASSVDQSVDDGQFEVGAVQMLAFRSVLLDHGISVSVSIRTYATAFNPSLFTRFVDLMWSIEPRLRVFQPIGADYWASLSQWIRHQLRNRDGWKSVEKLVLMRRPKLK